MDITTSVNEFVTHCICLPTLIDCISIEYRKFTVNFRSPGPDRDGTVFGHNHCLLTETMQSHSLFVRFHRQLTVYTVTKYSRITIAIAEMYSLWVTESFINTKLTYYRSLHKNI